MRGYNKPIRTSRFGKEEVLSSVEYGRRIAATLRGKVIRIWAGMLSRVARDPDYRHVCVLMSREEFVEWAVPALEKWIVDNPGKRHSIDRKDSKKHYSLDNIRFIELKENVRRRERNHNVHAPKGMAWCRVHKKYLDIGMFSRSNSRPPLFVRQVCKTCRNEAYKSDNKKRKSLCRTA